MPEQSTYKKRYKMTAQGLKGKSITVNIPPDVIKKKAELAHLSVEDFIKQYQVVAQYNGFDGVLYTFERIPERKTA